MDKETWAQERLPMYRAGIVAEEGSSRRLETSLRKAKQKRLTMLQVRRRSRSSAVDAGAAARSEAISPSEPRQLTGGRGLGHGLLNTTDKRDHSPVLVDARARMDAMVARICASSDPHDLSEAAEGLLGVFHTIDGDPTFESSYYYSRPVVISPHHRSDLSNQWSAAVVPRILMLLTTSDPTSAIHFEPCLMLLNAMLNREELTGFVSAQIMGREVSIILTRILLLGPAFNVIKETAILILGNVGAYFATSAMAACITPRSSAATKDLGRIISEVPGAIDTFKSLLLGQTGTESLRSLALWALTNIMSPRGQRYPSSREAVRRFSVLVPALLTCISSAYPLSNSTIKPSAFVATSPTRLSTSVPSGSVSSSSSSSSSSSVTQLRALTVLELLTRFGGTAMQTLIRAQGGLAFLISLISSCNNNANVNNNGSGRITHGSNSNDEVTIEALKIIGHVFDGNSPEGVQLCLQANALPLLCMLASNHLSTDVRLLAVTALHDFLTCPRDIVAPAIASYQGNFGGDISPVVLTLVQKSSAQGDMAQRVRDKACFGVLNLARNEWIDAKIQETLVVSLAQLLRHQDPAILSEAVSSLDNILSTPNTSSPSSPASSECMTSRLLHIFEAASGLEALQQLLASMNLAQNVETSIEQLLEKHFPSTQITSMELDDTSENKPTENLCLLFADTVDSNGRLW